MTAETSTGELYPENEVLLQRLKRIEGQIRGLQHMLSEERACSEIILQLMAARKALDAVGTMLLHDHIDRCLPGGESLTGDEDFEQLRAALKLWAG